MAKSYLMYAGLLMTLVAAPAFAQTATPPAPVAGAVATDAAQQQQIEQGLQSGQLSTKEAAKLEQGEKHIDNVEAKDLKNGTMSPQEQARLNAMQNKEEGRIQKMDANTVTGNPNAASSKRMQEDVQRNVNQENRIENGVNNGTMTNREVGRAEKGEARIDRKEARAGRDGHVGPKEQGRIQGAENRESAKVYRAKHNGRMRHEHPEGGEAPGVAH